MAFKSHESSACHCEAVEVVIHLPATTTHIGIHLSRQYAFEMENKRMLLKVLSAIGFLCRQGLSLRGHDDDRDGNLIQVLERLGEDDDEVHERLQKKVNRYTSPDIQIGLIKIMVLHVLRNISSLFQESTFLAVMINETTDITNQEQVTVVMRRIDASFEVCEEF